MGECSVNLPRRRVTPNVPLSSHPGMIVPARLSRTTSAWLALLLSLTALNLTAQERPDTGVDARIRDEGLNRSRVLGTAIGLSDLQPPRLAGSPGYLEAARWAVGRIQQFGVPQAGLEPWGPTTPSWVLEQFSVEMTAPFYQRLNAHPQAWSPSIRGTITAPVVVARIEADSDTVRLRGTLRGRIVLLGAIRPLQDREEAPVKRFTTRELDSLAALTEPGEPASWDADVAPWVRLVTGRRARLEFLRREGAVAVIQPSERDDPLTASGGYGYPRPSAEGVPAFDLDRTQFNRLLRLVEAGRDVRLALALRGRLSGDSVGYNVVAEIPGSDPALRDEVVMLGGHLDSWTAGSGATDNAAGCAVAIEVLRIMRALDLKPRRTIRIALWDAEETSDDYAGSIGYVRRHFGNPDDGSRKPDQAKISAYFNFDNGSGRIRGINLQGAAAARPLFEELLAPFADLGVTAVSIRNVGSTDHMSFASVGIPAFQFIQDPLDYSSRTHHTSLDTADYLIEDDLKQAAVVVASLMYHVAMRDELVPRVGGGMAH
jgi:carboxypeptidase Q